MDKISKYKNFIKRNFIKISMHCFAGIILGCFFPFIALIYLFLSKNLEFSISNIGYLHYNNSLLYIIDLAPCFEQNQTLIKCEISF